MSLVPLAVTGAIASPSDQSPRLDGSALEEHPNTLKMDFA
jgi:hypothetical protein